MRTSSTKILANTGIIIPGTASSNPTIKMYVKSFLYPAILDFIPLIRFPFLPCCSNSSEGKSSKTIPVKDSPNSFKVTVLWPRAGSFKKTFSSLNPSRTKKCYLRYSHHGLHRIPLLAVPGVYTFYKRIE
jgi:hypothetical protein